MPEEFSMQSVLASPGTLVFPANLPYRSALSRSDGRAVQQSSGHWVVYNRDNRRILATDPDGHPLHECEWTMSLSGLVCLKLARIRLDWGQWVGIKPAGLVNATTLDLSRKPGWQRLRPDDLRQMAAQALRVPLDEVRFFYSDDDLTIAPNGIASIRHKKDALYVLDDGTFTQARFMACMGALHWERIDFLPVVELFQSLLPGTGSAAFELIRGLYDDQNQGQPQPMALRYRGIPTYPSDAAYRLFSAFFTPQAPGGADPFTLFMDPSRSSQVTWVPSQDPPRRYFLEPRTICVTIKNHTAQKATVADDPTGLSYVQATLNRLVPCERTIRTEGEHFILSDRGREDCLPISPGWEVANQPPRPRPPLAPVDWRSLFEGGPPSVEPKQAFSAVLLYPDDEQEISEASSQPFVSDYLQDLIEQTPEIAEQLRRSMRVLIDQLDSGITSCVTLDGPRNYTVLFQTPALAQRQVQLLWNQFARADRLDWLKSVRLMPSSEHRHIAYQQRYEVIYAWLPFALFESAPGLEQASTEISAALAEQGTAFVVGPSGFQQNLKTQRCRIVRQEAVETLPTFQMHRTILPKARLKAGLTLFQIMHERTARRVDEQTIS